MVIASLILCLIAAAVVAAFPHYVCRQTRSGKINAWMQRALNDKGIEAAYDANGIYYKYQGIESPVPSGEAELVLKNYVTWLKKGLYGISIALLSLSLAIFKFI